MKKFELTEDLAQKILIALLVVGAFFRLFNISGTFSFLGDQGRDALIYHRLLIDKDPVFIGPVTSVGNMYLGPAFYYVMLPFYALTYPSPMGPVYATALIGVLTIYAIYALGKKLVGYQAAIFGAFLYTFGWIFIQLTRFSWNPNPAPIVSLFMIWFTYLAYTKSSKFWIWVSICFSALIQLHYLTLLSLLPAGLIWLYKLIILIRAKSNRLKLLMMHTSIAVLIFLVSLTPLVLFDIKHEFGNARAFYEILFGKEDQLRSESELLRTVSEMVGRSFHILFEVTLHQPRIFSIVGLVGVILLLYLAYKQAKEFKTGLTILLTWLITGIIGTALYKSSIYDHYIAYLFPVTVLVLGVALVQLSKIPWAKYSIPVIILWFLFANAVGYDESARHYDFRTLGWSLEDIETHSKLVEGVLEPNEPYSLVLLTAYKDYDAMNYRYFLTTAGKPPLERERIHEAKTLVIIDEEDLPLKQILDLSLYEIVIFPEKSNAEVIRPAYGPKLVILRK